jgi:hypothetical protein
VAQSIGNNSGLQDWAETLFSIPINGKNATGPTTVTRLKSVNEGKIKLGPRMTVLIAYASPLTCEKDGNSVNKGLK